MPRVGEAWDDFVRRKAPPSPPLWQLGDRGKYKTALAEALREGELRAATRQLDTIERRLDERGEGGNHARWSWDRGHELGGQASICE